MIIKVLGKGCMKCEKLHEAAKQATTELDIDATFEKVTDLNGIMSYGVMQTPALVVDGKVKVTGKVPTVEDLKEILQS